MEFGTEHLSQMSPYIIQSIVISALLLLIVKKSLKDYNTSNINYIKFQLLFFVIKVFLGASVVTLFCVLYPDETKGLILSGTLVFLVGHFIEAMIYNKLILLNKDCK